MKLLITTLIRLSIIIWWIYTGEKKIKNKR